MRVMTRPGPSSAEVAELTTASVSVLAVAAAVATSTSYVLQPELPVVARDVGSSVPVIGVVAALPIGGYLFGLALLVPLADRMRSHRLISGQLSLLAAGLVIAAVAATPLVLGAGLFVSGLCASTGAQMSSLAGRYSAVSRRGRAVGTWTMPQGRVRLKLWKELGEDTAAALSEEAAAVEAYLGSRHAQG